MSSPNHVGSPSRKRPEGETLSPDLKRVIGALLSELIGTTFLVFVAVGVQVILCLVCSYTH